MELLLPIVVLAGAGFLFWRFASGRSGLPPIDATPDRPVNFGWKIYWVAVPCDDLDVACSALARSDSRFSAAQFEPCNWRSAFDRMLANFNNREVFVSPPVDGWVLMVNWMPADEMDQGGFQSTLEALSSEFGRAAAFGSHRGVSLVSWALAVDGKLVRAFTEADGETYFDFGEPPPEEDALDLVTWAELEQMDAEPEPNDELYDRLADEETVVELAVQWTIDPTTLADRDVVGVGRLARPA